MDDPEQQQTSRQSSSGVTNHNNVNTVDSTTNSNSTTNTSGVSTTQQNTANQGLNYGVAKTNPYAPAEPALQEMINRVRALGGNTGLSPTEQVAMSGITQTAERNATFNPEIEQLAADQFAGGGFGEGADGVRDAFDQSSSYYKGVLDPSSGGGNPYVDDLLSTIRDDVTNQVGGQFAAAGRSFSGAHSGNLSRNLTSAMAPILFEDYWRNQDAKERAAAALGSEARATSTALDSAAGNVLAARGLGADTLETTYNPFTRMADAGAYEVDKPISRTGDITGLLTNLAGVGGSSENFGLNLSEGTLTGRNTNDTTSNTRSSSNTRATTTSEGTSRTRGNASGTQTVSQEANPWQTLLGSALGVGGMLLSPVPRGGSTVGGLLFS